MLYSHVIDDALEEKIGKSGLPRAALDRELARASIAGELRGVDAFHQPAVEDATASIFPRGRSRKLRAS